MALPIVTLWSMVKELEEERDRWRRRAEHNKRVADQYRKMYEKAKTKG